MYLAYFDENKYTDENPYFYVGGFLVPEEKALDLENTLTQIQYNFFGTSSLRKDTEFHGKEMFHGKGQYKRRKLNERVRLFEDISTFIINNKLPVRLVCIDVNAHRKKYAYPTPEYRLGLMIILKRFCDYLEKGDGLGAVLGDYEKDEITRAIIDFSEFKVSGSTPMYHGRHLGRLIDTVYFTHSHHSRFLQVSDVLVYMAGRYERELNPQTKWHDIQVHAIWEKIKASTDIKIQSWP